MNNTNVVNLTFELFYNLWRYQGSGGFTSNLTLREMRLPSELATRMFQDVIDGSLVINNDNILLFHCSTGIHVTVLHIKSFNITLIGS